jgi:hypothetical protein
VEGWFRRPAEPVEPVEATDRLIEGGAHDDAEAAIEAGGEPVDDDRVEGPNSA